MLCRKMRRNEFVKVCNFRLQNIAFFQGYVVFNMVSSLVRSSSFPTIQQIIQFTWKTLREYADFVTSLCVPQPIGLPHTVSEKKKTEMKSLPDPIAYPCFWNTPPFPRGCSGNEAIRHNLFYFKEGYKTEIRSTWEMTESIQATQSCCKAKVCKHNTIMW